MTIEQSEIRKLIPHAGAMCLLERVEHWDETRIRCSASSHRRGDNPLRRAGRLRAICAVEYAAQAMAVHGALVAPRQGPPRVGLLVSLRDVACAAVQLDDQPGVLTIEAQRQLGGPTEVVYAFAVRAGGTELLTGRATVVFGAGSSPASAAPSA